MPYHAVVRSLRRPSLCSMLLLFALTIGPAIAGPQHWGFGQSYLAAVERVGDARRLVVYEAPLRAKNAAWITRWVDSSPASAGVLPGGIAAGDFWPKAFGRDYVVLAYPSDTGTTLRVLGTPEKFSSAPWATVSSPRLTVAAPLALAAGDVLGQSRDQLLLLAAPQSTHPALPPAMRLTVLTAPSSPALSGWFVSRQVTLPYLGGTFRGFACGDFWGDGRDYLAIATQTDSAVSVHFLRVAGKSAEVVTVARNAPALEAHGLTATDYVKDGFDTLTFVAPAPASKVTVCVAPAKTPGAPPDPGPNYNFRTASGQFLPGYQSGLLTPVMTGALDDARPRPATQPGIPAPSHIVGVAGGRVFGYIDTDPGEGTRQPYNAAPDAEIAFTHRVPAYSIGAGAPRYGWPLKGEVMGYDIALKNNGQTAIPAGSATLKVWINTPYRNADTNLRTLDAPDMVIPITQDLAPFNPAAPNYVTVPVRTTWPYDLIPCGPGATWKKANVFEVGERWLVASLECRGDGNARNDRYEVPFHAWTFRPIFRALENFADRSPTVAGDACSLEYSARKLADAVTCMWERSGTYANEDVLQRAYFDGYEIGWPDDLPEPDRTEKWRAVQDKYEGWRELRHWLGLWGTWERFNWNDGGAELHETAHLFHPIGDLYQYTVAPVFTGSAAMEDGTPVQIATYAWGPDSFSGGEAVIGPPASEQMRRFVVGARGSGIDRWWDLAPDRFKVRVLDRDGNTIPNAEVALWTYRSQTPFVSGFTGSDGVWDTGYPLPNFTVDRFGRRKYVDNKLGADALLATVHIAGYQAATVVGQEDRNAHGRHTMMLRSFINEHEWTWDFQTNYRIGAPAPSFTATAAVQANTVRIGIQGTPGATYRLYRRWEPAYRYEALGDYPAPGGTLTILQDMAAPDSRRGGRFRAHYDITEVVNGVESQPVSLQVTGITNARGLSDLGAGDLLVAANAGIANPWAIRLKGETPHTELFYHYRFGHTGQKIVPSRMSPGRYYATLLSSDTDPDYRFDIADPPTADRPGYDVRNGMGDLQASGYTTSAPYTITVAWGIDRLNPGDGVTGPLGSAIIQGIAGNVLTLDRAIFPAGQGSPWFSTLRLAGRPGSRADRRELNAARGLAALLYNNREYLAIADTGNARLVLWDARTAYVASYTDSGFRPAAVAADPADPARVYVLSRPAPGSFAAPAPGTYQASMAIRPAAPPLRPGAGRNRRPLPGASAAEASGAARLYLLRFNGAALSVEPGYPVALDVGDDAEAGEMGLAAAKDATGNTLLAVTDAARGRILEGKVSGGAFQVSATHTAPTGTYAGPSALVRPTDVAWSAASAGLRLYALDSLNRVVRVR